jgi:hypothetical protein
MPIELAVPAKMVAVPLSKPVQLASPLLSTLAEEAMFPLHNPLLEPTHQMMFANGTGLAEPLYVPIAVNCIRAIREISGVGCGWSDGHRGELTAPSASRWRKNNKRDKV